MLLCAVVGRGIAHFSRQKMRLKLLKSITSISKITCPETPETYPRHRLFDKLDKAFQRPILFICAPAGFGKTTLVSDYLKHRQTPGIWYRLDRQDEDLGSFFYYLSLAAEKEKPGAQKRLPLFTPEYRQAIPTFSRRYFEKLFACFDKACDIVLDNYQEVPEDSLLHEVISTAITSTVADNRLTIISRESPPATMTRLQANRTMTVINQKDLRLNNAESQGIAKLQTRGKLASDKIEQICALADGWAAGIILLSDIIVDQGSFCPPQLDSVPQKVFDYFATEIFNRIEETQRDFLRRTAFVEELTPQLTDLLTQQKNSHNILTQLHKGNYFTQCYFNPQATYCYHPLFRKFLQTKAAEAYPPEEIARLQTKAARFLEEEGNFTEAALLYIASHNWQALASLAETRGKELLSQGRDKILQKWLTILPENILSDNPHLQFLAGQCRMAVGSLPAARLFFERAFHLFTQCSDPKGSMTAWALVVETYLHEMGDTRPLDQWLEIMDTLLGSDCTSLVDNMDDQISIRIFSALAIRQPHHPCFAKWKEKAFNIFENSPDISLRLLTGFYLHSYNMWIGDYPRANYILTLLKNTKKTSASPLAVITGKMAETWVWLSGDCEGCLQAMEEGLALASETGVHIWDYLLMVQGVAASLSTGEITQAEHILEKMAANQDNSRILDRFYFHYESSWCQHLQGHLSQAIVLQEQALLLADSTDFHYPKAQSHLAMAHLCLDAGDKQKARDHLATSLWIGRRINSSSIICMSMLILASMNFAEKEQTAGSRCLRRAMAIARQMTYVNFSWWHPKLMADLCVKALSLEIESTYVTNLVKQRDLTPDIIPEHLAAWPWRVRISTLGCFEISVNDELLLFHGKPPKKVLELLAVLIALTDSATDESLTEILWPDADGDAAHKSLEVSLARLRSLLGGRETIIHQKGLMSLNPRICYVDCRAFDLLCTDLSEKMNCAALDLYRGEFLPQETGWWAVATRERLRDKFIGQIRTTALSLEKENRRQEAINIYQQGIEAEPLAEEIYGWLIACHETCGNSDLAASIYRRCVRTLHAAGKRTALSPRA